MFWLTAAQVIVREEDCLSSKILGHFSAGSQLKAWLGGRFYENDTAEVATRIANLHRHIFFFNNGDLLL